MDITDLSLRARLAIALRLFAGYCDRCGIDHPEVVSYLESLWQFTRMPGTREAFDECEMSQPLLIESGLGYEYPPGFEEFLTARGVPDREFRKAVCCTTEVLFTSMYGAADEGGSRRFLDELAALAASFGVAFPDTGPFASSRWSDGHGWGTRPSAEEIVVWRYGGPPAA